MTPLERARYLTRKEPRTRQEVEDELSATLDEFEAEPSELRKSVLRLRITVLRMELEHGDLLDGPSLTVLDGGKNADSAFLPARGVPR